MTRRYTDDELTALAARLFPAAGWRPGPTDDDAIRVTIDAAEVPLLEIVLVDGAWRLSLMGIRIGAYPTPEAAVEMAHNVCIAWSHVTATLLVNLWGEEPIPPVRWAFKEDYR